jgi:hypothetical protein
MKLGIERVCGGAEVSCTWTGHREKERPVGLVPGVYETIKTVRKKGIFEGVSVSM